MKLIVCGLGVALFLGAPLEMMVPEARAATAASASIAQASKKNAAALQESLRKIGAANRTLAVAAGNWNIDQSVTIPANVHFKLEHGATFQIKAGQTLTVQGSMEIPGTSQLFFGAGNVRFGDGFLGEVYPQWWGVIKGVNDTAACQAALDAGAKTIRFSKALYAIDAVGDGREGGTGLFPASNSKLLFDAGAVLQAITTDKNDYSILNINGKTNVVVDGASIRGERKTHTGKGGEWGHGIRIVNKSKDIVIKNVHVSDCWGDGIYLGEGTVEDIYVENSKFDNNRRNGSSITNAKNVLFKKCTFSNSNATSPFKGVDIEPNVASDIAQNLVFEDCTSYGNVAGGFSVARDDKQNTPVTITFRNCTSVNDGMGFGFDIGPSDCPGLYTIKDCVAINSGENGFRSTSSNLQMNIDGFYIVNPNQKGEGRPQFGSAFSIWNAVPHHKGQSKIAGNIDVRNMYVYSDDGKCNYALYTNNELGEKSGLQNLDIQLKTNLPPEKRFFKGPGPYLNFFHVHFPDNPVVNATEDVTAVAMAAYIGQKITNTAAAKDITLAVSDSRALSLDSEYTFEVTAARKLNVNFGDALLLPEGVKACWSDKVGSRLKVRSEGKAWFVVEQIGSWNFVR